MKRVDYQTKQVDLRPASMAPWASCLNPQSFNFFAYKPNNNSSSSSSNTFLN